MRQFDRPGRSPVTAPNGMAATSHPLASQVAIDVLKSGGNAMDAAIAACAVQCVVEPQSTGIGGDCFAMYAAGGSDQVVAFNGSGRAPKAADLSWFQNQGITQIDQTSPHSVTIPGAVDAWSQLNADHGRMALSDLLQPAIEYARDGYPVAPRVRFDWENARDMVQSVPTTRDVFMPDGDFPNVGARHHQPRLAASLEAIANEGRDAFYHGPIAHDIVDYLSDLGGLHHLDDFAAAKGDYVTPIKNQYQGVDVHECPPNGQGIIALLLINMLSHLPQTDDPMSADRLHLELECCRLAYKSRGLYVGDPAFSDISVDELLSDAYAKKLVDQIDPNAVGGVAPDLALPEHHHTVYISVVDKDRNCASFINTLFHSFGSGLMAPKSGVLMQNRGQGFVLEAGHPNCIAGGKRPLHTIIPAMVTKNGRAVMPFGVMGGEYQAFGHMQFLSRYLAQGCDIQEAMDCPRMMVNPFTGRVDLEPAFGPDIRAALRQKGHDISESTIPIGGSQAIAIDWDQGMLSAGSDPRKDGCAIGY